MLRYLLDVRWRLGLLDICAILILLVVLFMPPRGVSIVGAFDHRNGGKVSTELARAGELQQELLADPGNGELAEELSTVFNELGRPDMGLRIAADAASHDNPSTWKAMRAVSSAHAERVELPGALEWAQKSLERCQAVGAPSCPAHEELRLRLYTDELKTGVKVLESGANPRHDPDKFRREMSKTHPAIRNRASDD